MGNKPNTRTGVPKKKLPGCSGYSMEGIELRVSKGKKPHRQSKRNIIGHTTTCPDCGRRVLPENLEKHIQEQHPDIAATNKFTNQIQSSKPNACKYCGTEVALHELERHILDEHPLLYKSAERRVDAKIAKEEARRHKKLIDIAKEYEAPIASEVEYDGDAPWEWRLAREKPRSQAKSNARTDSKMDLCRFCGVSVKPKNMKKHLRKVHGHIQPT